MIDKDNWKLAKKYLDYRLRVDQITEGSMMKEKTHLRYLLTWSQENSFREASNIRPSFSEYILSNRMDDKEGQLSPVYIKKTLATARLFFTWLSDNIAGYKHIKQSWVKTIKAKRLSNVPRTNEYVTLQEILAIAERPARDARARRARSALVFLFLSGMRISAFVSLPIQAVDISKRVVYQYPSLGVKTKNNKHGITYLWDIPELIKIVKDWDDEIRAVLPSNGFWFAPLSFQSGEIDPSIIKVGKHRHNLARRDLKLWLESEGLLYHSPHKFRHGHIHYGLTNAKNIADFKAVSMNAMHANMEITDQFYSVLHDEEVKNRISALSKNTSKENKKDVVKLLEDLLSDLKRDNLAE